MNPNRAENQPAPEVSVTPEADESAAVNIEHLPATQENSVGKQPPAVSGAAVTVDPATLAQPAATVPITDDSAPSVSDAGKKTSAKNTDRIEKEWIEKAKNVLMQNQDDPHAQKEAVSKVKAEYIQKRFNKVVRTDDVVSA